jgi:hypothetical protein
MEDPKDLNLMALEISLLEVASRPATTLIRGTIKMAGEVCLLRGKII